MIKNLTLYCGFAVLGVLCGCQHVETPHLPHMPHSLDITTTVMADELQLSQFTKNWQIAFDASDFETLRDFYEADAWLMAQGQPARKGVDEIMTYLKALRSRGDIPPVRTMQENQVIDGDYSFSTTQWWFEYPNAEGTLVQDSGRSFVVFKRGDDKKWRLWRAVKNQSPDISFEDNP